MLRRLLVPLIIEQLLAMTVGMADTVMITYIGQDAVSGVSLVDALSNLIIQVLAALATGGAVVVSQYLGRHDLRHARSAARQLIYVAVLFSGAVMIISLALRGTLLRFLFGNMTNEVLESAVSYFWICAISYPFLAIYNAIAALFRSMGNSKISMWTALLMNIINIGGSALLIYVFHWGPAGAATATLFSRAISAIVMLVLIRHPNYPVFITHLFRIRFDAAIAKSILRVGIPNGLENGIFHIGKLLVQGLITSYGTAALAANALLNSVHGLLIVPGNAVGLGLITVVGQCVGAGEYAQAKGYVKKMMGLIYLMVSVLGIACFFFSAQIMGLFNLSQEALQMGSEILRLSSIAYIVLWPTAFAFPNALRAAGDAKFTMAVSIASMWVCRVGMCYVLRDVFGLYLMGVWIAMFVDWLVRSIFFLIRYLRGKWEQKNVLT